MSSSSQPASAFTPPSFSQPQAGPSQPTKETDLPTIDGKKQAEFKRRDKTLGEFMVMLDDYKPLVGHAVFQTDSRLILGLE